MPLVLLLAPAWALTPGVDLTDDPMVLTPQSTWSDTFADQVFDAGDVDGDGYDDVLVCDGPANSSN